MEEEKSKTESEVTPKKMGMVEFWIRFAVWFALAVAAPFVYVSVRFGIFTDAEATKKVSGWGIIAFAFLGIMLVKIIRTARKGLNYGSMAAQCIDGVTVLIPVVVVILMLELVKANVAAFEEFLIFTVICEGVAIPINPLRRWAWENNMESFFGGIAGVIGKFFDRKK